MEHFVSDLSLLVVCSAILASIAVILKQPIIIAYIVSGILIGPYGLGLISNLEFIEVIAHLGIALLLFLAGLNLHPRKLFKLFNQSSWVALMNAVISFILAFVFSLMLGFGTVESLCVGLALMFSSTILVVKLLPTTTLHQERMGEFCIGILILQDLIAVGVLAFIQCLALPENAILSFAFLTFKLVLFIGLLVLIDLYLLQRVMHIVERLHEVLFILGVAWCFGIATFSSALGLFYETGAFFAGVVLARHPISLFIAERLKPLRDFFLVLFFFSLGARLDLSVLKAVIVPAFILAVLFMMIKPWVFTKSLVWEGEKPSFAQEIGIRLGQLSEFSLLVGFLALDLKLISDNASQLIHLVTIMTFIASSYIVVYRYQTPIGISDKFRD